MTATATAIHRATVADLPKIELCAAEFYAASKFLNGFDLARFCDLWTGLLESETGVIFSFDDENGQWAGMIGGLAHQDIYSGVMKAVEFFWHVRAEYRGRGMELYREFEQWAREKGCATIHMVHLADSMPERLDRVYRRMGFIPAEVHYVKELSESALARGVTLS